MKTKYTELENRIVSTLKTVRKLGVSISLLGGYSTGYTKDNLPPYPVGLFGALALIDGENVRSQLGISFKETLELERGFNSTKKPKETDSELFKLGASILKRVNLIPKGKKIKKKDTWPLARPGLYERIIANRSPTTYPIQQPIQITTTINISLPTNDE